MLVVVKSKKEQAYKPGFCLGLTAKPCHLSRALIAQRLYRSTRGTSYEPDEPPSIPKDDTVCLTFQPIRFTLPSVSPPKRCALTAPFHPYRTPEAHGGLFSAALSVCS